MPRLRNSAGVVVSVSEETAASLGSEWAPADTATDTPTKAPRKRPAKKTASTSSGTSTSDDDA